jgi:hypothetical protein
VVVDDECGDAEADADLRDDRGPALLQPGDQAEQRAVGLCHERVADVLGGRAHAHVVGVQWSRVGEPHQGVATGDGVREWTRHHFYLQYESDRVGCGRSGQGQHHADHDSDCQ